MTLLGLSELAQNMDVPVTQTGWWLAGGLSPSNCVAAYQAKGVVSQSESYINLANPGTYNLSLGVAPSWSSISGWGFNGTQYLNTGYMPDGTTQNKTLIVRFSGYTYTDRIIAGCHGSSQRFELMASGEFGKFYGNGGRISIAPSVVSGVLCVAGAKGYYNGNQDVSGISFVSNTLCPVFIGGRNYLGSLHAGFAMVGNIQAMAIYNTELTAGMVSAVTTAINTL